MPPDRAIYEGRATAVKLSAPNYPEENGFAPRISSLIAVLGHRPAFCGNAVLLKPDQRDLGRPVPSAKICLFPSDPNHLHIPRRLVPSEGRLAIVTNAGRDAVDADGADNERRLRRTAKPCGPDAPTLVSSVADVSARRWWQESPVTRESAEQAVKTIARGMPGDSGVTVVTNACAFYLRARGCGRAERPAFPAPLLG
jgi:hypothetical protein